MRFYTPIYVLTLIIILIDLYTYKYLKNSLRRIKSKKISISLKFIFWAISLLIIVLFIIASSSISKASSPETYSRITLLIAAFSILYIPKIIFCIFQFIEDLINLIIRLFKKKCFIHFVTKIGLFLSVIFFLSIIYGITIGRYNYKINKLDLKFENLPQSFNGIKIVQISDFHIGSYNKDYEEFEKIVRLINEQNPDLLFFTGDMVNNFADELNGYIPILQKLHATIGKYSILGNHDYGDYSSWINQQEKKKNLEDIKQAQIDAGFELLLNSSIKIKRDSDEIAIIGTENWSLPPFHQYGDLKKSMANVDTNSFKILLTHDPTYWDSTVVKKTNIDLTFAGHTHGMQFGINIFGIHWSPSKYVYKQWGGLYEINNQYLYVNTGIGVIGIPGRIGMPPEITVVRLYGKNSI
ncbi:MAG: metallophosphoesterase [Bacteroidetes bacterium]|nr:MAG: metallophosphoesterase [Bacteroidota bacterium]